MRNMGILFIITLCLLVIVSCQKQKTQETTTLSTSTSITTNNTSTTKETIGNINLPLEAQLKEYIDSISFYNFGNSSFNITEIANNRYHVSISFNFNKPQAISDWNVTIKPSFNPTFHWAPHLTPTDKHIIAQHTFRSPALIVQDDTKQLVIIPDLDSLAVSPVKWYMDMNAEDNYLMLGISDYVVEHHVLFVRKNALSEIPSGKFEFGFYIFVSDKEEELENPWRNVLSFLWENYGKALYDQGEPINRSLDVYVEHTYNWAFNTWKDSVYQEFTIYGKKVGAPVFIVNITQSPNYDKPYSERETRSIWNQAWFSSLRSASGLYRYAVKNNREDLKEKALLTKELALLAPMNRGLFPSVIATEMQNVYENNVAYWRSKGWNTAYWGNSDRNPFDRNLRTAPYHILDMSYTTYLMLNWYMELEQDERLKTYALTYADKLITLQSDKGFFPAWIDLFTFQRKGILDESPETSMSVTFLLKAYEVSRDEKYLISALKAMEAVINEIIPTGRWEDFETYWSCSIYGQDRVGQKFPRNNMYKQNTLSMYWTAEALYYTYKHTNDERYLKLGQRVLDELLMYQASWQPPFIYINALGGFGVMNADGEWNDARQSLFAELIIKYGEELNIQEYRERGIAALYASFVMMYCPENERTKEQWEKVYPFFNELDYGFMMENYAHGGLTSPEGLGIGEFTIYDWGNGAASEAYMRIIDHYGENYLRR